MPIVDDAAFAETADAVRNALNAQGFLHLVGAKIDEIAYGRVVMSLDRRPEVLQQHGLFHGGAVAFLVDNSTTAAAGTVVDRARQRVLTAEFKVNMLSPAKGERLTCIASVVKPGRSFTVVEAKVYCRTDGEDKLTAVALATIANLDLAKAGELPAR